MEHVLRKTTIPLAPVLAPSKMTPIFLAQIAIDSIELGLAYGLLSVGLSLVFGVLDVLNCAHGALYMIGGYFAFTTVYLTGLPPWAGVLAATGGCFFLGILIELVAVERVRGDPNTAIIMTVGIAYLLEQVALLKWGGVFQSISPLLNGEIQFAGLYASLAADLGCLSRYHHIISYLSIYVAVAPRQGDPDDRL